MRAGFQTHAVHAEHAPAKRRFRHVAQNAKAGPGWVGFLADNRSLARQVSLSGNPLGPGQVIVRVFIACELSRKVLLPPADLMLLAELSADFLLPGHHSIVVLTSKPDAML